MKKKTDRKRRRLAPALCALCVLLAATLAGCGNASRDTAAATTFALSPEEETITYEVGRSSASTGTASYDAGIDSFAVEEEAVASDTEVSVDESAYGTKLIRTIRMEVETTDFDTLLATLQTRAEEMGGYVESTQTSTPAEDETRWSYLTIRIPADCLDDFLDMVGENGNVTYTDESVEDVTLSYVDLDTRLSALRTEQETLLSMMEEAEALEDVIAIQSQLTEVGYEIESYESQLRVLENQIDYSTVYLSIDEVERETETGGTTFGENVGTRIRNNFYRLRQGLRNFAIGFLGLLPILVILAVIVVVIVLILRRLVRHKEQRKERRAAKRAKKKEEKAWQREIVREEKAEQSEAKKEEKTERKEE